MCGICGIVDFHQEPSRVTVEDMTQALFHRGPDMGGITTFPLCTLGHRRLSILDLSDAARQPMLSPDGLTALVFNGEIYNFQELRACLTIRGSRFRTRSDTEVILELYREMGESLVHQLNGMFSFGIWDESRKRLVLARDRLGKKPLYYSLNEGRLSFSSELYSLIQDPQITRTFSDQALLEYLMYDFIPAGHTIFDGVLKLRAGHIAVFDESGFRTWRYWSPPEPESAVDFPKHVEELRRLIQESVRIRLISDVPLGAFLSGGIDSTLVTSLMRGRTSGRIKTFNIAFPGTSHDESKWAALSASYLQTDHTTRPVDYDIERLFPHMIRHFGEPFGDSSAIPTWHLCKETRKEVTVALSGDGGDEIFGGYERYLARRIQVVYDIVPQSVRTALIEPLIARLPSTTDYYGTSLSKKLKLFVAAASRMRTNPDAVVPRTFSCREVQELTGMDYRPEADPVLAVARETAGLDPVSRMMYTDIQTYLAEDILTKVDRMSMAHALEVRCPLLDYRVVEFGCRLPLGFKIQRLTTKRILRALAADLVPHAILRRAKYGFQVPLGEWFKSKLRAWAEERLYDFTHSFFQRRHVERLWGEHLGGKADHAHKIWLLLVFNEWFRQFGRK